MASAALRVSMQRFQPQLESLPVGLSGSFASLRRYQSIVRPAEACLCVRALEASPLYLDPLAPRRVPRVPTTGTLPPPVQSRTTYAVLHVLRAKQIRRYGELAVALIDQVHSVLGQHHPQDARRKGWISGLSPEEVPIAGSTMSACYRLRPAFPLQGLQWRTGSVF